MDVCVRRVHKAMEGRVSPDVVVHNILLNGDYQAGRIKECLGLWKVTGNDGCHSIVSYSILITSQGIA